MSVVAPHFFMLFPTPGILQVLPFLLRYRFHFLTSPCLFYSFPRALGVVDFCSPCRSQLDSPFTPSPRGLIHPPPPPPGPGPTCRYSCSTGPESGLLWAQGMFALMGLFLPNSILKITFCNCIGIKTKSRLDLLFYIIMIFSFPSGFHRHSRRNIFLGPSKHHGPEVLYL